MCCLTKAHRDGQCKLTTVMVMMTVWRAKLEDCWLPVCGLELEEGQKTWEIEGTLVTVPVEWK